MNNNNNSTQWNKPRLARWVYNENPNDGKFKKFIKNEIHNQLYNSNSGVIRKIFYPKGFQYEEKNNKYSSNAGGRKQVIFDYKGVQYQRYIFTNKHGKRYVKFNNKKVDVDKLKNIAIIHAKIESISPNNSTLQHKTPSYFPANKTKNYW
jgi:hypothetical protein